MESVATASGVELSIVIATHNSAAFVDACLGSIHAQKHARIEVIVVDNASRDETQAMVSRFAWVRVATNVENAGHCRAVNQALGLAVGEHVMVLDIDTVLPPGAARSLLDFMKETPGASVIAPRMLNGDGSVQETARRFPTMINGMFGRQTALTRLFPNNRISQAYLQRRERNGSEPFEADWVSASCMMFRRDLAKRIGEWDEGYRGYWVDADWCRRAHDAGRVYCVPAVRVIHLEQNRRGRRKDAYRLVQFHAGALRFYRKHCTRGVFDPRTWIAAGLLGTRAALLIAGNTFLPADVASTAAAPAAPDVRSPLTNGK